MPIRRTTLQSDESIQEFYERPLWKDSFKLISSKMLELVGRIDELFPETDLIVTTSHQRLCLHELGKEEMKWVIILAYSHLQEYHVTYKVPKFKSPWENAWMSGECKSLDDAIIYCLKAMNETGLWSGNSEFIDAMKKFELDHN